MNLFNLIKRVQTSGASQPLSLVDVRSASELAPCVARCGGESLFCRIEGLPLHMTCFLELVAGTRAIPGAAGLTKDRPQSAAGDDAKREQRGSSSQQPAERRAGGQPAAAAHSSYGGTAARLRLAGVLDQAGLWLPGHTEPVAVAAPADIAAAHQLAGEYALRQLWIHPSMHEQLGLPTTRSVKVNPAEALPHPFTGCEQVVCDPDGLAAWVNVKPASGNGRRIGIVFPAFETRFEPGRGWRAAADGAELLAGVLLLNDELGENYYFSPNDTGAAVVRSTASSDPTELGVDELPPMAGEIVHAGVWARHLLDEEDDEAAWIHRFDPHGAEPGVFGAIWVATGPYRHVTAPAFDRRADQKRAGYWLVNIPREGHGLDSRLPDLLRPLREVDARGENPGGPAWFHTDSLVLFDELGVPFEISEAWIAQTSARAMRKTQERYSAARSALQARKKNTTAGAAVALDVLTMIFKSRIGDFSREGSRIYRADIRDAIKARAAANQYRRLRAAAQGKPNDPNDHGSGRWPLATYSDACYYVSPEPDPWAAADRIGLPIGDEPGVFSDKLGHYDHEESLPLSVVREFIGTRSFHTAFQRIVDGKSPLPSRRRPRRAAR